LAINNQQKEEELQSTWNEREWWRGGREKKNEIRRRRGWRVKKLSFSLLLLLELSLTVSTPDFNVDRLKLKKRTLLFFWAYLHWNPRCSRRARAQTVISNLKKNSFPLGKKEEGREELKKKHSKKDNKERTRKKNQKPLKEEWGPWRLKEKSFEKSGGRWGRLSLHTKQVFLKIGPIWWCGFF
jgi:hypothetical protein